MVVGIIALLVTILMPSLGRALELARRTICKTQLHALGRAWHLYFRHDDIWMIIDGYHQPPVGQGV